MTNSDEQKIICLSEKLDELPEDFEYDK